MYDLEVLNRVYDRIFDGKPLNPKSTCCNCSPDELMPHRCASCQENAEFVNDSEDES